MDYSITLTNNLYKDKKILSSKINQFIGSY